MRRRRPHNSLVVVAAMTVVSCASPDSSSNGPDADSLSGRLTVLAASSLTEAFDEIGEAFVGAHPGVEVTFSFGGSNELVAQLNEGAPADVLATADEASMTAAAEAGVLAAGSVPFASNTFGVIVGRGNPHEVDSVADLADPDLLVVLCAEVVPCGRGAAEVLERAGVTVTAVSFEHTVKGAVSKVTSGEADAGIVFVSDLAAAGDAATGVEIPADLNVVNRYPVAVVEGAPHEAAARAFAEFLTGAAARAILVAHGFGAP